MNRNIVEEYVDGNREAIIDFLVDSTEFAKWFDVKKKQEKIEEANSRIESYAEAIIQEQQKLADLGEDVPPLNIRLPVTPVDII